MTIDRITLQDLAFFKGDVNIFSLINKCTTQAGAEVLRKQVLQPPATYEQLQAYQEAVRFWQQNLSSWTTQISNGTLVMIERFFDSADTIHDRPGPMSIFLSGILQKLLNKDEYSFVRFSISHIIDLLKGCNELLALLNGSAPRLVREELEEMKMVLDMDLSRELLLLGPGAPQKQLLLLSFRVRREMKGHLRKMMLRYARMDALQSMARAGKEYNWQMPELLPPGELCYHVRQLFHPLLKQAKSYDADFSRGRNFLFLTGANMSGKSTFIRSLGVAAVLAHLGMAVPAQSMQISFLEGIISNMQVEDNILKGESYFYAEVNRMKVAAEKLSRRRYHLVLMDELFKGTNVHDAYECTRAVIEGLLEHNDNLMALSTHLYELADTLQSDSRLTFKYFHTEIDAEGNYHFTYRLKEGVSNDRIGFLVMKKEGVLELLRKKRES